jgi:hypothetical protein
VLRAQHFSRIASARFIKRLSFCVAALVVVQLREFVKALSHVGVLLAQCLLPNRQSPLSFIFKKQDYTWLLASLLVSVS